MNQHVATGHEKKINCEVCHYRSSQKGNLKRMFHEFMMEISHPNMDFVNTDLPERVTLKTMLYQYILKN